ncbi:MAG TPA: hypothetical protein PK854_02685 [Oscillospiraceae bacterium]|nr:hypothetical protein [Oscillospiraceae bacterium]HPS34151.1 hypothetical protein [Oscillospiraceae bacterium]
MDNDDYARKLLSAARLCAFCTVVVLILAVSAGVVLLPRVVGTINDLTLVAANLKAVDWQALSEDVGKAADVLEKVDFNKLNQTIGELQKAIAPVAELFGTQ